MSTMHSFLESLFGTGELEIAASSSESDAADDDVPIREAIQSYELLWRMQQPLEPPEFNVAAAMKAATVLRSACEAVVYRRIEADHIEHLIRKTALVSDDDPGQHYSVDLVFHFLPQVAERAARVSESDPLLEILRTVGRQWPLSSVGISGCEPQTIPKALRQPSLWQMYIDRIISRNDKSRLNIPLVREAVAAAIGPFPHLAPEFSSLGCTPRGLE